MLEIGEVNVALNGKVSRRVIGMWPTLELRALAGNLPFDEVDEVNLALKTCQDLDDQALEELAKLDLKGEALAAVEQLAYSAAIRRHYAARLMAMRPRLSCRRPG